MKNWRALLGRLLSTPPLPTTRLSAREATAIAEAAAWRAGAPGTHGHAVLVRKDGAAVWSVAQVSIGSGWLIDVDDATGTAGPLRRWGLR
ncbi:hypothetical protein ACLBX9_12045 [Methylobacterium sp. A49B]